MTRRNLLPALAAVAVMPLIVWLADATRAAALADRAHYGWTTLQAERVGYTAGVALGIVVTVLAVLSAALLLERRGRADGL